MRYSASKVGQMLFSIYSATNQIRRLKINQNPVTISIKIIMVRIISVLPIADDTHP